LARGTGKASEGNCGEKTGKWGKLIGRPERVSVRFRRARTELKCRETTWYLLRGGGDFTKDGEREM